MIYDGGMIVLGISEQKIRLHVQRVLRVACLRTKARVVGVVIEGHARIIFVLFRMSVNGGHFAIDGASQK
jgi:hypothetical protein